MNIPEKLKQARLSHNLTLEALGAKVSRSKQYMYLLEKGGIRLSYEMAVEIAAALGTTPDKIFYPTEEMAGNGLLIEK